MPEAVQPVPDPDWIPRDSVDALIDSWHATRPDLDVSPVAVISRLARVRGHIDGELNRIFEAHGLSGPNFAVLVTLARIGGEGGVSQRRLMDELGLTSGTISVRIDRLVEEQLVERRADPASRRNALISLTAQGRDLLERVVPAHLENERRLLAALSDPEQALLAGLLRQLLVEFEGSRAPAHAPQIGLTVAPAHLTMALRASVGLEPVAGLLVRAVLEDGAADRAGIRAGDVLVAAGDRMLRSIAALYRALADPVDGMVSLTVLRGTELREVQVEPGPARRTGARVSATAGQSVRGEHAA